MKMRSALLTAASLALSLAVLPGAANAAALKPGYYTVTIPGYCNLFHLHLDADKITVGGVDDLADGCGFKSGPAIGAISTSNKKILTPNAGIFIQDGAYPPTGYPATDFILDLANDTYQGIQDAGNGTVTLFNCTTTGGACLAWKYSTTGYPAALPPKSGSKPVTAP
jgi:hypothetical protein